MTQISLRAYNQEIDNLINQNQIDEAIGHCRYILKQFPKHVDTYRLLGKACLEGRRYPDAVDVFNRVLAVIPDDMVANLGMSIIREDEGDLNAAIAHMERAFEVQPSNQAVQDELRRLYARRDGSAPHKIRLTRGALVRMYERGSLFPQAIAEARAALADDPSRIDLEIILARIYYHLGQKDEAVAAASHLVGILPFCFEANRILAEILPDTPRAEDAAIYRQNLQALDPYAAFVSPDAPESEKVADDAVMLEHLDWLPVRPPARETPTPISAEPQFLIEEPLPEWLETFPAEAERTQETGELPQTIFSATEEPEFTEPPLQPTPSIESAKTEPLEPSAQPTPPIAAQAAEPAELPQVQTPSPAPFTTEEISSSEWFHSPDWVADTEQPLDADDKTPPFEADLAEEIASAEIPEWLQRLAPPEEEFDQQDEQELRKLEELLPPLDNIEVSDVERTESESDKAVQALETPAGEQAVPPEWRGGLENFQDNLTEEADSSQQPIPGWLRESLDEAEPAGFTSVTEEDTAEIKLPSAKTPESAPDAITGTAPLPENAAESQAESTSEETVEQSEATKTDDIDAALAWLEGLAARHGAEQEALFTSSEQPQEKIPDWVQKEAQSWAASASAPTDELPELPPDKMAAEPAPLAEEPPAVTAVAEDTQKVKPPAKTAPLEILSEPLPDWMQSILDAAADAPTEETQPAGQAPAQQEARETSSGTPADLWISEEELEEVTLSKIALESDDLGEPGTPFSGTWPDWMQDEVKTTDNVAPDTTNITEELLQDRPLPQWLQNLDEFEEAKIGAEEPLEWLKPPAGEEPPLVIDSAEILGKSPAAIEETPVIEAPVQTPVTLPGEGSDPQQIYQQAQSALKTGDIQTAMERYAEIIAASELLPSVIADLENALYQYPVDLSLWQTLGDAYLRSNRLQDALDAYTKAEELLH